MYQPNYVCGIKIPQTIIQKSWVRGLCPCQLFYLFRKIFSPDFERKFYTGCGKAFNTAFPNRQGVSLAKFWTGEHINVVSM